jgi:hypothetical protein
MGRPEEMEVTMHRANPTHCFWHATDPIAPARSIFHRAELNLPTDPLPAEENTTFRNYPIGRAMRGASKSIQYEQPVSAARPTTLCAYEHGQNAARRGKHVQACPFDTGTVEWREWRAGFRAVFGPLT